MATVSRARRPGAVVKTVRAAARQGYAMRRHGAIRPCWPDDRDFGDDGCETFARAPANRTASATAARTGIVGMKPVNIESRTDEAGNGGRSRAPLVARRDHAEPSLFLPENLLREARRQKGLVHGQVPPVCVLDPDGDIAAHLRAGGTAMRSPSWACYHTALWELSRDGLAIGIVDRAVGAPFAVLVAEQLFVSGCRLLISVTSAGQIVESGPTPYFVLIDRALRDEGTSYHYLPAAPFAAAPQDLLALADSALAGCGESIYRGASWTTDAPFRETASTIESRRDEGILAVEMEAAALYAFAAARARPVLCLAHVTNQLARVERDFEKGEHNGAEAALRVVAAIARGWLNREASRGAAASAEPAAFHAG
jgi:uridine phosphorylase